ncbi:hypothetical protein COV93_06220 [Candidatus Woesearchaeota archaeon CG11_big_fil_rev_8_21_14_0_20_43_8]|nr:MAG: hypothetical protein COV93_06220 [Candidatus Woesearchaeota archaeon CG11_big_fil_rev_8_21_14_0_20_43_8]PIO05510.1 MAG: hypothetical protein COT47_04505 [Candidatus Woesearchaeota archaeon CG08_land_8_20_14_0_20_43_7]
MRITFDTTDKIEDLKRLRQLLNSLIDGSDAQDTPVMTNVGERADPWDMPVAQTPAPSAGAFSMFGDDSSSSSSPTSPSTVGSGNGATVLADSLIDSAQDDDADDYDNSEPDEGDYKIEVVDF